MLWQGRVSPQHLVLMAPLDEGSRGISAANRNPSEARQGQAAGKGEARLGIYGHMVGRSNSEVIEKSSENLPPWQETRRVIWALSRTAAGLLYPPGTPKDELKGVATCRWAVQSTANGVDVLLSDYQESGQRRASYSGLQTCGLVWVCPACAARISETRRRQVNDGLQWAKTQDFRISMMTLTARHGEGDDLASLLSAMKRAKKRLHQHRAWKRIKPEIVAMLTATEVTHGKNGWHPHFHVIVILKTKEAEAALARMGDPWRGALRAEGLDGNSAAFDIQDASAAGRYVTKWGAGEELTLGGKKKAKGKGQTPLQLLEAHKAGNQASGDLWLEYTAAFYRRTQLDGLKKLVDLAGLDDLTDAEAAQDTLQDGQERAEESVVNIDTDTWRQKARQRRTDILDAVEKDGASGVWSVIHGPGARSDIARPPPPRPGGIIERLLASIRPPSLSTKIDPETGEIINTG